MKTLGKLDFKFLRLVTTEGVGLLLIRFVDLKLGGFSSPSTGRLLSIDFTGSGMCSGNFESVHRAPEREGRAGFQFTSCSKEGLIGSLGGRAGITGSSPNISFGL